MFNKVLNQRLDARKNPLRSDEFKLLTLVLGEVETIVKRDPTRSQDDITLSVVRKLIESNKQTIELMPPSESRDKLSLENELLRDLLPRQMTEDEIRDVFTIDFKAPAGQNVIGAFNQYMKTHYAGQYDGKLVSKVAKELSQETKQ